MVDSVPRSERRADPLWWLGWVLIIGVAVFLRLYASSIESADPDEVFTLHVAQASWFEALRAVAGDLVNPPAYYLIAKLMPGGDTLLGIRYLSVAFGIGIIVTCMFAAFTRPWLRLPAMGAAALIALNSFHVNLSAWGRSYTLYGLLALLVVLATMTDSLRDRPWFRAGHALSLIAFAYTHFFAWLYIGAISLAAVFLWRDSSRQRFWFRHVAIAIAAFVPWLLCFALVYVRRGGLQSNLSWLEPPDAAAVWDLAGKLGSGLVWLAVALGILHCIRDARLRELGGTVAACALLPPLFLLAVSVTGVFQPLFYPRYVSASIPFLALLAGVGLFLVPVPWIVRGVLAALIMWQGAPAWESARTPQRWEYERIARKLQCTALPAAYANEFSIARPLRFYQTPADLLVPLNEVKLVEGPLVIVWKPARRFEDQMVKGFFGRTGGHILDVVDFPYALEPKALIRVALVAKREDAAYRVKWTSCRMQK